MTQVSQERPSAAAAGHPEGGWVPPPLERPSATRRMLAASALLSLLAGVPTALAVSVGSPLPGALPAWGDVTDALTAPLGSSLIVDALAVIAWTAWAHFAVCLTVELVVALRASGSVRLRPAPRVPLGGAAQQLARRLVEAALVTATVATSVGVAAGSGTILTPARPAVVAQEWRATVPVAFAAQHQPAASELPATGTATRMVREHQAAGPHPEYVVEPPRGGYYDSLWDIADRFLGDGQRWREIYELNESRDQPDGRALTRPDLIRPGWRLYLPGDAAGLPIGDAEPEGSTAPAPHQETGPTPEEPAVTPSSWPSPVMSATPAGPQGSAPPPPTALTGAGPSASATAASMSTAPSAGDTDGGWEDADEDGVLPGRALGGLLAAAALASLATRRHRQRRRRPPRASIPLPEPSVARAEGQLRVLAEPDDLAFVDEMLRALTLAAHGPALPDVRAALLRPGHLDLKLSEPMPDAPAPFIALDGGLAWRALTRDRPLITPGSSDQVLPLLPLLLTVGRDAAGPVLLDVEASGSLAIEGADADVIGLLAHLVVECVLAPWADAVEVLLVGFEPELGESLELLAPDRVTMVKDLDPSLLRVLEKRSSRVTAEGARLLTRIRASRAAAEVEVRPPLLVVHAAKLSPTHGAQLAALVPAAGHGGIAVVALGPWPGARATWTLGEPLPLQFEESAPTPCRLDPDEIHALAAMLQMAREPVTSDSELPAGRADVCLPPPVSAAQVVGPAAKRLPVASPETHVFSADLASPYPADAEAEDDPLDRAVEAYLHGSAPVTVGLLGPITVHADGSIESDRRARLTEIVAYLATHRAGVPLCDFDAAIWPDRPVTLKTRNQAITRTRAWLGVDEDDVSWLRPLSEGALRLSSRVLVDWELFCALQKRADGRGRSGPLARRDLGAALRLVRGRPLSQLPAHRYGWLAETYLEQEIPSAVIDVAHSLAQILLQDDDADGVVKVARLALDVDRYDERPWRDLLQAHELRGEHRQIALVVDQLHELLDVELDDELQPETAELIERLLPRRRRA